MSNDDRLLTMEAENAALRRDYLAALNLMLTAAETLEAGLPVTAEWAAQVRRLSDRDDETRRRDAEALDYRSLVNEHAERADRAERERDRLVAVVGLNGVGYLTLADRVDFVRTGPFAESGRVVFRDPADDGTVKASGVWPTLLDALLWLHSPEGRAECERAGVTLDG